MPIKADQFVIEYTLDTTKLVNSLTKAKNSVDQFSENIKTSLTTALSIISTGLLGDFLYKLGTGFAQAGSNLYFLSQRLGENVDTLGAWREAAKRFGGSADGVTTSISNLYSKLQSARFMGDMRTTGLLQYLGINPIDANGQVKKTTDILTELAPKFRGMDIGKAQFLGGQLGIDPATVVLLRAGGKEMDLLIARSKKMGVMNVEEAKAQVALNNQLEDTRQNFRKLGIELSIVLMPYLIQFSRWIINFITAHKTQIIQTFREVINVLNEFIQIIIWASNKIDEFSKSVGISLIALGKIIGAIIALKTVMNIFTILILGSKSLLGELTLIGIELYKIYQIFWMIKDIADPKKITQDLNNIFGTTIGGTINKIGEWLGNKTGERVDQITSIFSSVKGNANKLINWIMPAQMQRESGGNVNARGDNGLAYGLFQIHKIAAKDVLGYMPTDQQMLDPTFNAHVRQLRMEKGMHLSGGNLVGALAYYHGDIPELKQWKQTGQSTYAQQVLANVTPQQIGELTNSPKIAHMQIPHTVTNNANKTTSIAIQNVHLPNVQNPTDFINHFNNLNNLNNLGWAYSTANLT